jgi:chemotaxis signal transduction protein
VALGPTVDGASQLDKLVCFELAGQAFGLPIRAVKETLPLRPLTRVCLVPPLIAGLMNLRGEVVAVLDLAQMVGLVHPRPRAGDPNAAVVILRTPDSWGGRGGGRAACGLLVDRLAGVRDVGALSPPPPSVEAEAASYLRGVAAVAASAEGGATALAVLDPERVLGSERLKPYRKRGGRGT